MKRLWAIALMLILGFSTLAYYYLETKNHSPIEVNVCLHLSDYNDKTISIFDDLRVKWVRTDWIITPDSSMGDYSQALQNNNIGLLAILDINTFNHKAFTLKEWNETITEIVVSDGFNNTDAVEIWNEPNALAYVDPDTYFEMLKSAYSIIKNYTVLDVVFSGVSPNVGNWKEYLTTIFAHVDVINYFDIMGVHLYDDSSINYETLEFVESLTVKPIWVTEIGKPSSCDGGKSQVNYLNSIYENIAPLVNKVFLYELTDNFGLLPEKENHFGLLTINGTKKEVYFRVWEISRY